MRTLRLSSPLHLCVPALLPLAALALVVGCSNDEHKCLCDAAITKTGPPELVDGQENLYQILVTYTGNDVCKGGALCVDDVLAPGLSCDPTNDAYRAPYAANPGWTCACGGHSVRCCLDGDLPVEIGALPAISLPVAVSAGKAAEAIENCATIEQGFEGGFADTDASNNRSCVQTAVVPAGKEGQIVTRADKVDVLLAVDNSRSMADKQGILALSIPDLVKGLVNPACVSPDTGQLADTPASPDEPCANGTARRFRPVKDIHLGVVSSSLGGHGSDACIASGAGKASNDDKGHLLDRKDPSLPDKVATYQEMGFLAWDPDQRLDPPGEADIDADSKADANKAALVPGLRDLVLGAGQIGCGYESQLESWYRFLIDPSPPLSLTLDKNGVVVQDGLDPVLLDQRKRFLRPDSALVIVMLSDENDCSIRESGQLYLAAQQKALDGLPYHLPRPRAICDEDPSDECCFSCGQPGPTDPKGEPLCAADPTCKTLDGETAYLDATADSINLRCWNQKRRFGIDFLYGTDRYRDALTSPNVADRQGQIVRNPIFPDPSAEEGPTRVRDPGLVFLTGLVGVPWQDISRTNSAGSPDLQAGIDEGGHPRGGLKSAGELLAPIPGLGYDAWTLLLGDPAHYPQTDAMPRDPLMIESVDARAGTHPLTGEGIGMPPAGNAINGHEWTISKKDDLQFACVFPLVKVDPATGDVTPDTRDCSAPGQFAGCDCEDETNDSPLCQAGPSGNTNQIKAKAYPGLRQLQVLRDVGAQGVVGSLCPAQLTDLAKPDFGYRPVIASLLERMTPALR